MRKRLMMLLACAFSVFAMAVAQDAVPQVIPALQSWKGKKGKLEMPQQGRVVVDTEATAELKDAASILVSDLAEMFGYVTALRTITSGRATSTMSFSHYAEVSTSIAKQVLTECNGRVDLLK